MRYLRDVTKLGIWTITYQVAVSVQEEEKEEGEEKLTQRR